MVWPLFDPILTACSFGWWLMAGADLFWEKSTVGWLMVAGLLWEKSTAGWWLISQTNRAKLARLNYRPFITPSPRLVYMRVQDLRGKVTSTNIYMAIYGTYIYN
jgi:hypothetical protein